MVLINYKALSYGDVCIILNKESKKTDIKFTNTKYDFWGWDNNNQQPPASVYQRKSATGRAKKTFPIAHTRPHGGPKDLQFLHRTGATQPTQKQEMGCYCKEIVIPSRLPPREVGDDFVATPYLTQCSFFFFSPSPSLSHSSSCCNFGSICNPKRKPLPCRSWKVSDIVIKLHTSHTAEVCARREFKRKEIPPAALRLYLAYGWWCASSCGVLLRSSHHHRVAHANKREKVMVTRCCNRELNCRCWRFSVPKPD